MYVPTLVVSVTPFFLSWCELSLPLSSLPSQMSRHLLHTAVYHTVHHNRQVVSISSDLGRAQFVPWGPLMDQWLYFPRRSMAVGLWMGGWFWNQQRGQRQNWNQSQSYPWIYSMLTHRPAQPWDRWSSHWRKAEGGGRGGGGGGGEGEGRGKGVFMQNQYQHTCHW